MRAAHFGNQCTSVNMTRHTLYKFLHYITTHVGQFIISFMNHCVTKFSCYIIWNRFYNYNKTGNNSLEIYMFTNRKQTEKFAFS